MTIRSTACSAGSATRPARSGWRYRPWARSTAPRSGATSRTRSAATQPTAPTSCRAWRCARWRAEGREMDSTMAQTARVNGTDLAYIEQGAGQPVVLVHGGIGDYREWDLQMPAFAASFRIIALSCRGAWPNRKLEPDEQITLDTFVEDLASFIKALDLAPVHLVGHSSPGGFGGLLLAHRHPARPPGFPWGAQTPPPPPAAGAAATAPHPAGGDRLQKFRRGRSRPRH